MALVKALPPESALVMAETGGVAWGWDQEMLAVLVELTHNMTRVLLGGFGAKKSGIPKPLHIPRPIEMQHQPKRKATVAEVFEHIGPMMRGRPHG